MAGTHESNDVEWVYDQLQREFHTIAQAQRGQDETIIVSALRSAVRRHRAEDSITGDVLRRCARAVPAFEGPTPAERGWLRLGEAKAAARGANEPSCPATPPPPTTK